MDTDQCTVTQIIQKRLFVLLKLILQDGANKMLVSVFPCGFKRLFI